MGGGVRVRAGAADRLGRNAGDQARAAERAVGPLLIEECGQVPGGVDLLVHRCHGTGLTPRTARGVGALLRLGGGEVHVA